MGASVFTYWPGITDDQRSSFFRQDCKAWGEWMAERKNHPEVIAAVKSLNAGAILTYTTDGLMDNQVAWVTPAELRNAALRLKEAVRDRRPETKIILETYGYRANNVDPIPEEFIRDLEDIAAIATQAEDEGAAKMTLEVNW
jgi:hypothetical protein